MLWSLWAAKEAAFKGLSRQIPALVFSPHWFEVDPNSQGPTAAVAYGDRRWPVTWTQGPDWVHAVVSDGDFLAVVEASRPPSDDSLAVRDLALRAMGGAGYPPGTIDGRPPVFRSQGLEVGVSLSHDGPYLAAAFPAR